MESYLARSEKTRRLAELLGKIETAVRESRGIEASGDVGPGLSDVARARLQRELQRALAGLAAQDVRNTTGMKAEGGDRDSQDTKLIKRLVAESETDYRPDQAENDRDKP